MECQENQQHSQAWTCHTARVILANPWFAAVQQEAAHLQFAPVAQLDRVPPSEGGGHRFESCRARHYTKGLYFMYWPFSFRPTGGEPAKQVRPATGRWRRTPAQSGGDPAGVRAAGPNNPVGRAITQRACTLCTGPFHFARQEANLRNRFDQPPEGGAERRRSGGDPAGVKAAGPKNPAGCAKQQRPVRVYGPLISSGNAGMPVTRLQ